MSFEPTMFLAILPQVLLLILALAVLIIGLLLPKEKMQNLGWITAVGMGLVMFFSLPSLPGMRVEPTWGGLIRHDWLSFVFAMLFMFGAGVTALLSMDYKNLGDRVEFYVLLIISTIGMTLMAAAADLIMLYLAIETVSIPMYVMAGFVGRDDKSTEAGFKYLLFGAMTSTIMLYGFSLLYGFSGTTNLAALVDGMVAGGVNNLGAVACLLLVLVGISFKISAAPFHFWAPDVYEGAPTPVAGLLSTASKAAGFAILMRFLMIFSPYVWMTLIAALSVVTMTLGNLIALRQKNIKRLLAYSSIAHAGYILIGIAAASPLGLTSAVYYLLAYLMTNLAAFGVVTTFGRVSGSDDLTSYHGMSRRSPWLAMAMLVAFLSLSGMPPFAGFVAKVFIFAAAVRSELYWLAVIGILNSIIGLYYYLTALKYVYLYRSEGDEQPMTVSQPTKLALVLLSVGVIAVGTIFSPWFNWAMLAAQSLLF